MVGSLPSSVDDAALALESIMRPLPVDGSLPSSADEAAVVCSLPSPMDDAASALRSTMGPLHVVGSLPSSVDDAANAFLSMEAPLQMVGSLPSSVDDAAVVCSLPSSVDDAAYDAHYVGSLPSPLSDAALESVTESDVAVGGRRPCETSGAAREELQTGADNEAYFKGLLASLSRCSMTDLRQVFDYCSETDLLLREKQHFAKPSLDLNPLDVVYEIVAELSQLEATRAVLGWVDVKIVVERACLAFGIEDALQLVHDALDTWDSMGVMLWKRCRIIRNGQLFCTRNKEQAIVKFLVQPHFG